MGKKIKRQKKTYQNGARNAAVDYGVEPFFCFLIFQPNRPFLRKE